MANINTEIGERLRGIRALCEWSAQRLAKSIEISEEQLLRYEDGEDDIPVSVLHNVSSVLGISTTELLTGETAKLRRFCVVRNEQGDVLERSPSYAYKALALNYTGRQMEPMRITIPADTAGKPFALNTHKGQEFHYCLDGAFFIRVGEHELRLDAGDSIYFDSSIPHGMRALGGTDAQSLVIITV
ncbi:MAG: cupin domain-containing protein [Oscillospiraceae bacterium]|jgi:transcriptional regulator with XRE-family HTH domain|nr:cupin domain-containing protein [Oscillospiraceae bacterium]